MPRIRTIKPEFPQSETTGRLSRDARLLFIQLWTLVDDEGRARAASRMLASLLYPYDDDARGLIDGWLAELERNECLIRYTVDGSVYLQITNWLKHQKIDHPTKSRLPAPPEPLAKPREPSRSLAPDLGPSTLDQEDDDGDRASERELITEDAHRLSDEITTLAGHDIKFVPPSWFGSPYRVQQWLNHGWPKPLILLSVREQMARKRDGPPSKIEYFEKGIARTVAQQSAPVPTASPLENHRHGSPAKSGLAAIDRIFDHADSGRRSPPRADENAVLLLPSRSISRP